MGGSKWDIPKMVFQSTRPFQKLAFLDQTLHSSVKCPILILFVKPNSGILESSTVLHSLEYKPTNGLCTLDLKSIVTLKKQPFTFNLLNTQLTILKYHMALQ